jgi:hypothetical protein
MITTILSIALSGLTIIGYGTMLCFGFWIGRHITNKIDEMVLLADPNVAKILGVI